MGKAGIYSLAISIPIFALFTSAFDLLWGWERQFRGLNTFVDNICVFLGVVLTGVVVHEYTHGLAWMILGRKTRGAITFGFQLKTLTPYAHCKEPIDVSAYRWGAFMPGLLLGILPSTVALLIGSGVLLAFGQIFTVAAGGDFLILWLVRSVKKGVLVEDHPTRAGCWVAGDQ